MQATYQRLRKLYYWPGMKTSVDNFVRQCQICQQAKPIHTKPAGLLQPLPIPERPWDDLTMDFIESLPRSEGYDTILVVVDRFTKYAHFIPLRHPFTASSVAKVFLDSIIKLHGVPLSIVTDRDKIFTSAMWRDIFTALGSKLSYITAYHPQTDGQSERVNQCVEQYLRCVVYDKPGKWRSWLPMAEFWYNSSYHTSAGCSPFQALYGRVPNFGAMPNVTMADDSQAKDFPIPDSVHLEQLRGHLTQAQARIKKQADKNRVDKMFQVGDSVLLKLQPYAQSTVVNRPCPKLSFKFFGPFKILAQIGAVAYRLELPDGCQVHPVFHVSQLKAFNPSYAPTFQAMPPPQALLDSASRPLAILQRRMVQQGNAAAPQVLIQWSNLPEDCATWEDYYVLRQRFPEAAIWEGDGAQGGKDVMHSDPSKPDSGESV